MIRSTIGRAPPIAWLNIISLVVGFAAAADDVEAPAAPQSVLLASMFELPTPLDEEADVRFDARFGIRKGRGVQVVKPLEFNERRYELNLSGPIVKTGNKKKNLGLSFELRF